MAELGAALSCDAQPVAHARRQVRVRVVWLLCHVPILAPPRKFAQEIENLRAPKLAHVHNMCVELRTCTNLRT